MPFAEVSERYSRGTCGGVAFGLGSGAANNQTAMFCRVSVLLHVARRVPLARALQRRREQGPVRPHHRGGQQHQQAGKRDEQADDASADSPPARHLLTYALPYLAVQARIELIRVQLAPADPAGARTLMREVDELLRRRPDLGSVTGEAKTLHTRLSNIPGCRTSAVPAPPGIGADRRRAAPAADARHASVVPGDRGEMLLSPHTIKSQAVSICRKLDAASRSQAVA
jgi:hypothetical protein